MPNTPLATALTRPRFPAYSCFAFIVQGAWQSYAMLLAMTLLACLGSFSVLSSNEIVAIVSTSISLITVRYLELRRISSA